MASSIKVSDFKPVASGAMIGFLDVHMPSGVSFHRCTVFRKADRVWVGPPSKPVLSKEGAARRDANGRMQYEPVVSFADRQTQDRWSALVAAALRASFPEALGRQADPVADEAPWDTLADERGGP